jgi:hypothetical protein
MRQGCPARAPATTPGTPPFSRRSGRHRSGRALGIWGAHFLPPALPGLLGAAAASAVVGLGAWHHPLATPSTRLEHPSRFSQLSFDVGQCLLPAFGYQRLTGLRTGPPNDLRWLPQRLWRTWLGRGVAGFSPSGGYTLATSENECQARIEISGAPIGSPRYAADNNLAALLLQSRQSRAKSMLDGAIANVSEWDGPPTVSGIGFSSDDPGFAANYIVTELEDGPADPSRFPQILRWSRYEVRNASAVDLPDGWIILDRDASLPLESAMSTRSGASDLNP